MRTVKTIKKVLASLLIAILAFPADAIYVFADPITLEQQKLQPQDGGTTTQVTQSQQNAENLVNNMNTLFSLSSQNQQPSSSTNLLQAASLSPGASSLLTQLQNTGQIANFNLLYGTSVPASGTSLSAGDEALLNGIAGDPFYVEPNYLNVFGKTAGLYTSLQGSATNRNNFNLLFGTSVAASGSPSVGDRTTLFGVAGDPNFVQANFIAALNKTGSLYTNLQSNATNRSDFNKIFGSNIGSSGAPSVSDRTTLFGVAGDPAFNQAAFLPVLNKTSTLYTNLQTNATNRTNFNLIFGTNVGSSGAPSISDRTTLFGVAGDPFFDQPTFLNVLTKIAGLYSNLQSNATNRANFNLLFGTNVLSSGAPSTGDRTILFGVAGDPNFVQATFLNVLTMTAGLYSNLQSNATNRTNFNLIFGTNVLSSGAPSVSDRTILFGVAGDPFFDQPTFLNVLTKIAGLYSNLQSNATNRANFNLLFGTNVLSSGAPSIGDRTILFGVAGDPNFVQATFLSVLTSAAGLLSALQADNSLRTSFNSTFGTVIPASGSPNAADRTVLFSLAGDPNFNLANFQLSLPAANALIAFLQTIANDPARSNFNTLFATTIPQSGAVTGNDLAVVFGVVGGAGYVQATFIAALNLAAPLYTAIQGSAQNRTDFNLLFATAIAAAGSPSVADRAVIFGVVGGAGYVQATFLTALTATASLYTNLQTTLVNRNNFNFIFNTTIAAAGSPTVTDRTTLFGVAGIAGFNQANFLTELTEAAGLGAALQADNALRLAFNSAYTATIPAAGNITSASDRTLLFSLVGDPNFNLANFQLSLPAANALIAFLQTIANDPARSNFNTLFATTIPQSGAVTGNDLAVVFGVVGGAGYVQATFIAALNLAAPLYTAIQGSAQNRTDFNLLFATAIAAAGSPSVADRAVIFGVVGGAGYVQATFLTALTATASLYTNLQTTLVNRNNFNFIFNTTIAAAGSPTVTDRTTLFGVAGIAGFNQANFLTELTEAAGLGAALQADNALRLAFNSAYTATIPAAGNITSASDRTLLFSLVGDPNFNLANFQLSLPAANALIAFLQTIANDPARSNFNTLFATTIPQSGAVTGNDLAVVFGVVGGAGYVQATFIAALNLAAPLYTAIQGSAQNRTDFNLLFATAIAAAGSPSAADRAVIFGVVGGAGYVQATFLTALTATASLYTNLQTTLVNRNNFNFIFNTTIAAAGSPTVTDRTTLFGVAGIAGFNQANFLTELTEAAGLGAALQADNALRLAFNSAYTATIPAAGNITSASDRTLLFSLVGDPNFNLANFQLSLPAANALIAFLQTIANDPARSNFNTLFATTIPQSGAVTGNDLAVVFGVVGGAGYVQATFIAALNLAAPLYTAIQGSAQNRTDFNLLFATAIAAAGSPSAADRAVIFGVVGGAGYVQATFLTALTATASLYTNLQTTLVNRNNFNFIFNTTIAAAGSPTVTDRTTLFGVAGIVGFNQANFLTELTEAAGLGAALQADNALRLAFNSAYTATIPAAGNITSASDRTLLFSLVGDPNFNLANFQLSLPAANALIAFLQTIANDPARSNFNTLFATTIPQSGAVTGNDLAVVFGVVGGAGYVQATFIAALNLAAPLYTAIQGSAQNRTDFNLLFATAIAAAGSPSAADRAVIFGVVGGAGYVQATFLTALTATASLYTNLQTTLVNRNNFNFIFNTTIAAAGSPTVTDRTTLFGVAGIVGFNQANFLTELTEAAGLGAALQADNALRLAFNSAYTATIPAAGNITSASDRTLLFSLVGDPNFNLANFQLSLPAANALIAFLQTIANDPARSNFNTLFATTIPQSGAVTGNDLAVVFGVVGGAGYVQATFIAALNLAAPLYTAIQGSAQNRTDFNLLFATAIAAAGSPSAADRAVIFGVVGGAGYVQATFLTALTATASLYTNLQTTLVNRNNFNFIFNTTIAAAGSPTVTDRTTLFGVAGIAGFNQANFLTELTEAAGLGAALQADNALRLAFNSAYTATIPAAGNITSASDRTLLFSLVGDPNFNLANFQLSLPAANALIAFLQTIANDPARSNFNTLFATTIPQSGAVTGNDLAVVFGVVGGAGYVQATFIAALNLAAPLYTAIQGSAQNRTDFNLLFATAIAAAGSPSVADRAVIFGVVGGAGYVQATFLTALTATASLYTNLQTTLVNRNNFNFIFNTTIAAAGSPTVTDRTTLFGVAGIVGFNQANFLTELTEAAGLGAALQADNALRLAFNSAYTATIPAAGNITSASDRTLLFSLVGDPNFNLANFQLSLPAANALIAFLQTIANDPARSNFNTLFATTIPQSGAVTGNDLAVVFGVVGGAGYVQATFIAALNLAAPLYTAIQGSAQNRTDFNLLFATAIAAAGSPSVADRAVIFGVVGGAGYVQATFLTALTATASLYTNLQTTLVNRNNFNFIFNTTIAAAGSPTVTDRTTLFGVAGIAGFNQANFLTELTEAAGLGAALQADNALRLAFNSAYTATIPAAGNITSASDRTLLFSLVGDPNFNLANFQLSLPAANALIAFLQTIANDPARSNFNTLFATTIPQSGAVTGNDLAVVFGVVGGAGYVQATFIAALNLAAPLYTAIQGSAQNRTDFNLLFATAIAAAGSPSAADRAVIFGVVGGAGYVQATFLTALTATASLYTNLQTTLVNRNNFNFIFNTTIAAAGSPTVTDRTTLFGVAGIVGFNQANFLTELTEAAGLGAALQADNALRLAFNSAYTATIPAAGNITSASDRTLLFSLVGDPNFNLANFQLSLPAANALIAFLQTIANDPARSNFNTLFATTIPQSGSVSQSDLAVVIGVVAGAGYVQGTFITALNLATPLFTAIQGSAANRANFNLLFATAIAAAGSPSAADRAVIFGVVGGAGYVQATFLTNLTNAAALYNNLQGSAVNLTDFNRLFNTLILAAGSPTPADRTTLFGVVGDPGYVQASFLVELGQAGDLLDALQADNTLRLAFNATYATNVPAAGNITDAAVRAVIFAVVGDPNFNINDILNNVPAANALIAFLQTIANDPARSNFNTLFATTIPQSGSVSQSDLAVVIGVVAGAGYVQGTFITALNLATPLFTAIQGSAANRANFNLLFATAIAAAGSPSAADRAVIFGVVGGAGYVQATFLTNLTNAAALYNNLQGSAVNLTDFNRLFNTLILAAGSPTPADRTTLFGVVGDPGYVQASFLVELGQAGDLLDALQADNTLRLAFNATYATNVPAAGNITDAAVRAVIFAVVGDPNFNINDILNNVPAANALIAFLQTIANDPARSNFNTLFATTIPQSGSVSQSDLAVVIGVVAGAGYVQGTFITALNLATPLFTAIQGSAANRANFNLLFATAIAAAGSPSAADRAVIFGVVGGAGYVQATFLTNLTNAAALYNNLQGSAVNLTDFNRLFNTLILAAGSPTPADRTTLFGVVGDPGYVQASFLVELGQAGDLLDALQADNTLRLAFNATYATNVPAAGNITDAAVRAVIFAVVGDPNFNINDILNNVPAANALIAFLQTIANDPARSNFNTLFATTIPQSGSVSQSDLAVVIGVVAGAGYVQGTFITALNLATPLFTAIQGSAANRANFNLLFATAIAAAGSPSAADRAVIFGVVGGAGYVQATFLTNLTNAAALYNNLQGSAVNLTDFNRLFNTLILAAGSPTPADRTTLFGVVGDPGYVQASFLVELGQAGDLLDALQADNTLRLAFNATYATNVPAAGNITDAAVRAVIFAVVGDPNFNINDILNNVPAANALIAFLQTIANDPARSNFNTLFATTIPQSGSVSQSDLAVVIGVVAGAGYVQGTFITALNLATPLFTAIQGSAANRANFNLLFATAIAAAGSPSAADRAVIFGVVGGAGYVQATFLTNLTNAAALYNNLQGSAVNLTDFNRLFNTLILAAGSPTPADRTTLFGVVGDPGYVQASFLVELGQAGDLLDALQADNTLRLAFNATYATNVPAAGNITDAAVRAVIFAVVGDPNFNINDILNNVPAANALIAFLQTIANDPARSNFNTLFATTIPQSGSVSQSDLAVVIGVVAGAGYVQGTFITALNLATPLFTAIQGSAANRANFNLLFATAIAAAGSPSAADRAVIFGVVGGAGYVQATFLTNLTNAAALYNNLQGSAVNLTDFNRLFNTLILAAGSPTPADRTTLFGVVGDPGYVQASFLVELGQAGDLLDALQADNTLRLAFNATYATNVPAAGNITDAAVRAVIFAVVGDPNFNINDILNNVPAANALIAFLQTIANDPARSNFNTLFATTIPQSGSVSQSDLAVVIGVVAGAGYVQGTFITALNLATPLFTAIQGSAANRANFNLLFATAIAAAGSPSAADRAVIFGVVGGAGYVQATFLTNLTNAAALYNNLQGSAVNLTDFNRLFNTLILAAGSPTPADRTTLFGVVGDPGYVQASFLVELGQAGDLLDALQADNTLRLAFNATYATNVPAAGNITDAAVRAVIFAVVGDPNFNINDILNNVPAANALIAFLQTIANDPARSNFNTLFATTIPQSGSVSQSDLAIVIGVVAGAGYVQGTFITALNLATPLFTAIQGSAANRANFNLLFATAIAAAGSPSAADRAVIFGVVGGAGYVQATFLTNLTNAAALYNNLQGSAVNLTDFNRLFNTLILAAGSPTPADRTTLFGVVGDPGYVQASFLVELGQAGDLLDALQADNTLRLAFNATYATNVPAAGNITDAAVRAVIFAVVGDPNFNINDILNNVPAANALIAFLQTIANDPARSNFNTLFATTIPQSGSVSQSDLAVVIGVVAGAGYVQGTFITALNLAGSLYTNLQNNATNRNNFNLIFGATVPASGSPIASDRDALFGVTGTPGYVQTTFITALNRARNLYVNLQSNVTRRNHFNLLFDTTIAASGSPVVSDRTVLFGVVETPGYTQAAFVADLTEAGNLVLALQADSALRTAFNTIYNTSVPASGNITDPAVRTVIFDLVGDPNFDLNSLVNNVPAAQTLITFLQNVANNPARSNFNVLFATSIPLSGAVSNNDLAIVIGVVATPGYVQTTFIAALNLAAPLYINLRNNATNRANFNLLFGTTLLSFGSPNAADRGVIFGVVGAPGYVQATFLQVLTNAAGLLSALQADNSLRTSFNSTFNTTIPASGSPNASDRTVLFNLAGDPNFNLNNFTQNLPAADTLIAFLQTAANDPARSNFNVLFGATIPQSGQVSGANLSLILGVVGAAGYNQNIFIQNLNQATPLYLVIQASSQNRGDLNLLFGTNIPLAGAPSASDRTVLFGIVATPGYIQTNFITSLNLASPLYSVIRSSATSRNNFNLLFGTAIVASGAPSAADRGVLFGVVGDPAYSQAAFITNFTRAANLYRNFQNNNTTRNRFNLIFGASMAASGSPSVSDRNLLFSVVTIPGYVQANFISALNRVNSLYVDLQASATKRNNLNLLFGTSIVSSGSPNANDRAVLFGIVETPGYTKNSFVNVLSKTAGLYSALQAQPSKRATFNAIYATNLQATGSPNASDRTVLFAIAGDPNFNLNAFLNTL